MPESAQMAVVPICRDLREARRRVVDFAAYVREFDAEVLDVTVVDVSEKGCRISSPHQLEPKAVIWLKIPGLVARRATIIWTAGTEAGCVFASALQPSALKAAVGEPRVQRRAHFQMRRQACEGNAKGERVSALPRTLP